MDVWSTILRKGVVVMVEKIKEILRTYGVSVKTIVKVDVGEIWITTNGILYIPDNTIYGICFKHIVDSGVCYITESSYELFPDKVDMYLKEHTHFDDNLYESSYTFSNLIDLCEKKSMAKIMLNDLAFEHPETWLDELNNIFCYG